MEVGVYDLLTVGVGAVGYAMGRSKGLAWQASGLLTLVGGGLAATVLSRPLGPAFAAGIPGRFAAWVVVYVLVATCLYVLTLRFKKRLEAAEYDELDRRFGGLLGAFKGLLVFAVLTLVAAGLSPRLAAAVKRSACGEALRAVVHGLRPALPEQVHDAFGPWLDVVDTPPPAPPPAPRLPGTEATPPAPPPSPPPSSSSSTATPPPAPPPGRPTPAAPAAPVARPAPPRAPAPPQARRSPVDEPADADVEGPARPRPAPDAPRSDPFDTSRDPVDPLAPPR